MASEIPNTKTRVKLFRRFPDDEAKEADFGPGYIKLYEARQFVTMNHCGARASSTSGVPAAGIQVVFRNHGTMKIRAAHVISVASIERSSAESAPTSQSTAGAGMDDFPKDEEKPPGKPSQNQTKALGEQVSKPTKPDAFETDTLLKELVKTTDNSPIAGYFDLSFDDELRYVARSDTADMGNGYCYGKQSPSKPIDFPLSFQFHCEEERDAFLRLLCHELHRLAAAPHNNNKGAESEDDALCSSESLTPRPQRNVEEDTMAKAKVPNKTDKP